MSWAFPSAGSTYVPDTKASGNLTVQFSRNPAAFAVAAYTAYGRTTTPVGRYIKIDSDAARRLKDRNAYIWPDGDDRPKGKSFGFKMPTYACERLDFPFMIPQLAADNASWAILPSHMQLDVNLAMTERTQAVRNVACTLSNWDTGHTLDVATNIGNWANSSFSDGFIQKTFQYAALAIIRDTNGMVGPNDLLCVMDPNVAKAIAQSGEFKDWLKQSPAAQAQIENSGSFGAALFGLPPTLWGFRIIVEVTPVDTAQEGATENTVFLYSSVTDPGTGSSLYNCVLFCARPGSIVAPPPDSPNFSAITIFFQEEMTVEQKSDTDNRRYEGHIVTNYKPVVTAGVSGFLGWNVLSH